MLEVKVVLRKVVVTIQEVVVMLGVTAMKPERKVITEEVPVI